MFYPVVFALLLTFTSVLGEKCVKNNFESDFDDLFHSDLFICKDAQPWQLANYTSVDIADVPNGRNRFIEPRSALTCESTFVFDLSEGTLEVNFYMKAKTEDDYLSVTVSEITSDGHRNRGHASFSQRIPNYSDGWNVLKIDLQSSFTGFISFMGEKSEDSIVLIDSFRYFAKEHDEQCELYKDEENDDGITTVADIFETTTESPTKPDPEIGTTDPEFIVTTFTPELETTTYPVPEEEISTQPSTEQEATTYPTSEEEMSTNPALEETTTAYPIPEEEISTTSAPEEELSTTPAPQEEISTTPVSEEITTFPTPDIDSTIPTEIEKCVTYNFENDFENLFTHNHELCGSFNTWELNKNSSSGIIGTRNTRGSFLTPSDDLSCISAFPIRMSPNGVVEVNVYVDPASEFDYIIVLVKNVVHGSVDTVAGSFIYEPSVSSFVKGWNVLRIKVVNLRSFDGYLILLGAASEGSTVLVDSFRYIPPWASADDEECQIR